VDFGWKNSNTSEGRSQCLWPVEMSDSWHKELRLRGVGLIWGLYLPHGTCTCWKSRIRRVRQRKAALHLRHGIYKYHSGISYTSYTRSNRMQRNLEAKWTQTWLDKAMKDIWLMAKQESQIKPKKPKWKMAEISKEPTLFTSAKHKAMTSQQ